MPRIRVPAPPREPRTRRLILVTVGVVALGAVTVAFEGDSATPSANDEPVQTTTTTAVAATTTTLEPKAIQAGVANLLAHEGATPQQIAAAPANAGHAASGGHRSAPCTRSANRSLV